MTVALRKESVDRNVVAPVLAVGRVWSLSARRAWIEMEDWLNAGSLSRVALRKESVDRNRRAVKCGIAWIKVALRKESVDRNYKERPGQKARPKSLSARRAWIEIQALSSA